MIGQDDVMAKISASVHNILGRESPNVIGLDDEIKVGADVHCVLRRESAKLIELEGAGKVIHGGQGYSYDEIVRVNHL